MTFPEFIELVEQAQTLQEVFERVVSDERDACVQIARDYWVAPRGYGRFGAVPHKSGTAYEIMVAIRSRKSTA